MNSKEEITLREGLDQFHKRNQQYFSKRKMSKQGEEFLRYHDMAHVVFGCDTTIYGEGMVKIWTTFGTNWSFWRVTKAYNEVSAFELSRQYSFRHVAKNILRFLITIPKAIFRAREMNKPWPFSECDAYLDIPVSEIRQEFNIQVLA